MNEAQANPIPAANNGGAAAQPRNARESALPTGDWFRERGWTERAESTDRALERARSASSVLEELRPVSESLEWRVAEQYWADVGVLAFARSKVPYVINNSGWLSLQAARLLFASCEAAPPQGRWYMLELGAGSGLFARLLLDAFRTACEQERRDYYTRLVYIVTDRSPTTLAQWRELGLFDGHAGHVELRTLDASAPWVVEAPLRAVFCNYVLDVLPANVVRRNAQGQAEQLHVRTHLTRDAQRLRALTHEESSDLHALIERADPTALARLARYVTLFEPETAFLSAGADALPGIARALQDTAAGERVLLNYAAISCLERALGRLEPAGFILVNDYGPTDPAQVSAHASLQQFGVTNAFGLNFPLLERELAARGARVLQPSGDAQRALHSRLIVRADGAAALEAELDAHFGQPYHAGLDRLLGDAREHARAGRLDAALETYRNALQVSPRDWALLGEVAELLSLRVQDHSAAITLARAALELNPVYSPWLWNVLGDALFCLERYEEAHAAYLRAEQIDDTDARTNLNLAYTFLQRADFAAALRVIARGLANDTTALYRERLLEKQRHVLSELDNAQGAEQQRCARRQERFSADQPTGPS